MYGHIKAAYSQMEMSEKYSNCSRINIFKKKI
jgi:hypothetical protein